ncbi:PrgI family protein [Eubacterium sp. AF22-8LB]|uniref:PrgI family protein n=1 Tax=Eubacterium sp. AF22-8LB TaxID=2292232 RepID=UPI000E4A85F7|nr:PrgI family protein [Eubacterium sp. AF22-8LB]RGS30875.1 PrgI family protein [Eubacterium sp. AF22-8LB]
MESSYVPKDITTYEEKIFLGLSVRQLFWSFIAVVVGLSFYFVSYLLLHIPQDICIYVTIALCFGIFAMGWAKWQNSRPYQEKLAAIHRFYTVKQRVIYSNEIYYFTKKGSKDVFKKSRKDKSINKRYCREYRK